MSERQREYDELFRKVLARMNKDRDHETVDHVWADLP